MPPPAHVRLGPLTSTVLDGSVWREESVFPSTQAWADDVERVLAFLNSQRMFERFLPRFCARERERDAALSEARTGFFFSRNGFAITAWEPEAVPNRPGDLELRWRDTEPIFLEVKGPTWEGELEDDERLTERQHQPKYINAEARSVDPTERVMYGVDKALPKFASHRINLVVIVDDLFLSPIELPKDLLIGRLRRLLTGEPYRVTAGIFMIRSVSYSGEAAVEYEDFFVPNPNAERPLPEAVQAGFLASNQNLNGPRWSRERPPGSGRPISG